MAGCLDNFHCPEWCEVGEKRNALASVASGVLFWTGWWLAIDAAAVYTDDSELPKAAHICGVVGTIAFFMVNSVSSSQVRGDGLSTDGCMGTTGARVWLLIGFILSFGAIIAAAWILFAEYVVPGKTDAVPGLLIFFQNFLIFFGTIVFKFGRTEDLWG